MSVLELTQLDSTTDGSAIDRAVDHAVCEGFASILVPPAFARRAADRARGSPVVIASVVGYPLGLNKPTVKAIEATSLAKDGVARLDVTPLPANVIAGDWDALRAELLEIARGARAASPRIMLDVHIDLDWGDVDLPALGTTIVRSAFDGVTLASASSDRISDAIGRLPAVPVSAIARATSWTETLRAAGAQRILTSSPPYPGERKRQPATPDVNTR